MISNSSTKFSNMENDTQAILATQILTTESSDLGSFLEETKGSFTKEQSEIITFILYQVLMPTICIIGLIGNLMSVGVIYKTKDSMAFTTYLKVLTISDSFVLLFGLTRFTCDIVSDNFSSISSPVRNYCKVTVSYVLGKYVWSLSQFLITVMSVERWVAVAFPLHIKTFVLEKYPKAVVLCVMIFQFMLRLPTMIWTEIRTISDRQTNETVYYVTYREWAINSPWRKEYFVIFLIIFDMLLPILIVLAMNAAILVFLRRRMRNFERNLRKESKRSADEKRLTLTLLVLSGFYLLSVTPTMITSAMKLFIPNYASFHAKEIYLLGAILNINILLVTLNSANDCTIYILSSKKFRQQFKEIYFGWYNKIKIYSQNTVSKSTRSLTESPSNVQ